MLKAYDAKGLPVGVKKPPASHRLFSRLDYVRGMDGISAQQLEEKQCFEDEPNFGDGSDDLFPLSTYSHEQNVGGWLESDEIEDFE